MTYAQNSSSDLPSPIVVNDQAGLSTMLTHLKQQRLIAVDTESDSLFSYYAKVCLIQISTRAGATTGAIAHQDGTEPDTIVDYLVDPLVFDDLSGLGTIFADSAIEIIMHAAYNDILTLQKEYDFTFRNIYDTQLTARILGWKGTGLARILEEYFGVHSDKRMQRTDWGKRPLEKRQTKYAQLDTHYLIELRKLQIEQLTQMDRLEEAMEAFAALEQIDFHDRPTQERTFWQMKAAREVPRDQLGILQALWRWREKTAQKLDRPPFKVVNDSVLVQIATEQPQDQKVLSKINGLSQYQRQRFGKSILKTVDRGRNAPIPVPPPHKPRPDDAIDETITKRYEALRSWRTHKARDRGVDPDIVFSNDILMTIAKCAPKSLNDLRSVDEIGPWKAKTYGPELIRIVGNN